MTPEYVLALLKEHWAIDADDSALLRLDGEQDDNFAVSVAGEKRHVLKIMHSGCDLDSLALQLRALEQAAPLRLTPAPIPTRLGESIATVNTPEGVRLAWLMSWREGRLLAHHYPHTKALGEDFGRALAKLTEALSSLPQPPFASEGLWDLSNADALIDQIGAVDPEHRALTLSALTAFKDTIKPQLSALPWGMVHNDANDYNVLVCEDRISGIIDFGDLSWQPRICDLAIALAYYLLDKPAPINACSDVLRGYNSVLPLSGTELDVLFPLVKARLAVSLTISSNRQQDNPDDAYITISQAPVKRALKDLQSVSDAFALAAFRHACGLGVTDASTRILHWLQNNGSDAAEVIAVDQYRHCLDLSIGSLMLGTKPDNATLEGLTTLIDKEMAAAGVTHSFGRYAEARGIYNAPQFTGHAYPTTESRTEHLGIDIFCAPGSAVIAPLPARVHRIANNDAPLDYGHLVILEHVTSDNDIFYTLYGHLSGDSVAGLSEGDELRKGQAFAAVGDNHENGGWTPHLHLQIILDLLGMDADFPGVIAPSQREVWHGLCPNPAYLLPVSPELMDASPDTQALAEQRANLLGPSLKLSYRKPLTIVRGQGQFLYDSHARAYLDAYNNVAHLGHSHPQVVDAVQQQVALLNTNTRYLHPTILEYAKRLTATLPAPLSVCYFVNSASEANELALRLARTFTQREDMLVMESAYHGHTSSLVDLSPYKYAGPGGSGRKPWVHEVPLADDYRGLHRRDDGKAGERYANTVSTALNALLEADTPPAAFLVETLPSVGGQIEFPEGYLRRAFDAVHAAGALCIADEVQVGFGRLGDSFWGFESQGATPDIVVLGKPMANGFPLGAVITTRAIANAFDNGMEYFSTYGGNPVACAAGLAVIDTIEADGLQANAKARGEELLEGLRQLQSCYPIIGDVRGRGLFLGVELVKDHESLAPAAGAASRIVNALRDKHVLAGTDGPLHNVIKLRPSMIINRDDVSYLLAQFDAVLSKLG